MRVGGGGGLPGDSERVNDEFDPVSDSIDRHQSRVFPRPHLDKGQSGHISRLIGVGWSPNINCKSKGSAIPSPFHCCQFTLLVIVLSNNCDNALSHLSTGITVLPYILIRH